jgi:ABC-type dipeptide/oligopeptide/nickel transport system permease subunit
MAVRSVTGSYRAPAEAGVWAAAAETDRLKPRFRHVGGIGRLTPSLLIGGGLVALFLLAALLAPALAPYPPNAVGAGESLAAPGPAHPFGTDLLGRDLFSRVLFGARAALLTAVIGVGLAAGIGIAGGLAAGYYAGRLDQALSRAMEVWMAFPGLLLALIVVARLGPSLVNAALALGVVSAPGFFRLTRGATLSARQTGYVEAAQAAGAADRRIILRHILPNIAPSLVVLATLRLGVTILAAGSLSFVGLAAQPPQAEWGALLANAREYMGEAPWLALYPGLAVTGTVVGLNLLGDGLRDLLGPRRGSAYR